MFLSSGRGLWRRLGCLAVRSSGRLSAFRFRGRSRKPIGGFFLYCIRTSLRGCGCAFWGRPILTSTYLNGRPSVTINFNMPDIWQTVADSWSITINQNVHFEVGICPEKFNLIKFKMADYRPLLTLIIMPDIWQTVPDS